MTSGSLLYIAAFLLFLIGLIHSCLGEKYILTRLFRRGNLPELFGSTDFTERTLRFAWHLTTVAWWGFAALLVTLAQVAITAELVGTTIAIIFFIHFVVAILGSRGQHLSWMIFLAVSVSSYLATRV